MENVTISMDEKLIRLTREEAAKAGKSLSDYITDIVAANVPALEAEKPETEINAQLAALERFLAGPKWDVTTDGRMPTAEERNARR